MNLFLGLLALLALAGPLLAVHYLTGLPEAPACPRCRRVTSEHEHRRAGGVERALALLRHTQVRRCTGCGWEGRMRWRWAVQQEGGGGV